MLCAGCGQPKTESFHIDNSFAYDVEALRCHACAARESAAWRRNKNRDDGSPPEFGMYFAVTHDDEED